MLLLDQELGALMEVIKLIRIRKEMIEYDYDNEEWIWGMNRRELRWKRWG